MILLANKLSENISSLRVDLYVVKDYIYFGELTFYPEGGFGEITPNEWDYKLGSMIQLPKKKYLNHRLIMGWLPSGNK